jgi:peptidoglycan hydrolase-like protein with peptidoglycan-binding domain
MLTSGTWVRRGGTIVLELGPAPVMEALLEQELESGQPTLRVGSRGSTVSTLQLRLAALGFNAGRSDGIFGALTDAAVRAFQRARRLTVDGIVGRQTWAALYTQAAPAPSPSRTPPPYPRGSRRDVQLNVPFRGYQSNDKAGCFRRCTEMAAAVGVRVGGPQLRIQVAIREDTFGGVTIDPAKAREGIAYIDEQLEAGRPVVVGVSYTDAAYNVDDITDHFVIITRRGTDANRRLYYGYHDPASRDASIGSDQNMANRFYSTSEGGLFRPAASAPLASRIYGMSMVRRNV